MPTRVALLSSIALIALLAAACSAGATPTSSASPPPTQAPSPSANPAVLLLRVTSEGGFIGPTASLAALPSVVVYADGRIYTPGAVPAVYPAPLLQAFSVRDVGAAGAQAILAAIRTAGLDKAVTDTGIVADTGTTVFTVIIDGQTITSRFASGGGPGRPGGNPSAAAALELLSRLTDPAETWGAASAPETSFVPIAFRVWVVPGAPMADPSASQSPMAWPLATTLDAFGVAAVPDRGIAGLRVGVVRGADATALAPFLSSASSLTPITSGGKTYAIYVRPLLPDEIQGS